MVEETRKLLLKRVLKFEYGNLVQCHNRIHRHSRVYEAHTFRTKVEPDSEGSNFLILSEAASFTVLGCRIAARSL
jgi:hypothetical protein